MRLSDLPMTGTRLTNSPRFFMVSISTGLRLECVEKDMYQKKKNGKKKKKKCEKEVHLWPLGAMK